MPAHLGRPTRPPIVKKRRALRDTPSTPSKAPEASQDGPAAAPEKAPRTERPAAGPQTGDARTADAKPKGHPQQSTAPAEGARKSRRDLYPDGRRDSRRSDAGRGDFRRDDSGRDDSSRETRGGLFDRLVRLDNHLLEVLQERTQLLAEGGGLPPRLEPELRAIWDDASRRLRLKPAVLRQILNLAGSLGIEAARTSTDKIMRLPSITPERGDTRLEVDAAGPVCQLHARLWAVLAAASGQATSLHPVVLSDPLVDLVKALNQAGATLSWETETVRARAATKRSGKLEFEGAKIFAGHNELNLYLLLGLALGHPGTSRFSGGVDLKLLDLAGLNRPVFGPLGARLAPLAPSSRSLPARLEAGGPMTGTLELPADCPPDLALGLAMSAWSYENGLTLVHHGNAEPARAMRLAAHLLAQAGIQTEQGEDRMTVAPAQPSVPEAPPLPLDALLAVNVLALARVFGSADGQPSRVRLSGPLPDDASTLAALSMLESVGLQVTRTGTDVTAEAGPWPDTLHLELQDAPGLDNWLESWLPLAAALVMAAPKGGRLTLPAAHAANLAELLEGAGKNVASKQQGGTATLSVSPGTRAEPGTPYTASSPAWAMGLALFNLSLPQDQALALANPGIMTEIWPGYWALVTRMSQKSGSIPSLTRPLGQEDDDGPQTKRRIRIG